jgi:ATP-dependent Lhr-like helicase
MASRKFRDIAQIAGLTFAGMPGKELSSRHLQANSKLFFNVFAEYEPDNILLLQAYKEVLTDQLEEYRLREMLSRIKTQRIIVKYLDKPSPFCFPIMVESLNRDKYSNESVEERATRLLKEFEL